MTIKHPPTAVEGPSHDSFAVGRILDVSPQLAMLMMAAGWVRGETRSRIRRFRSQAPRHDRRRVADRRSADSD